ncbi:Uma2 family endonuclease [Micromonospora echinaurantiaca]|uniref:Uma2 family endonuclease n=1 Tax=Micromonospora echinaurantiaca TaxID=47857 RepID=UPI0037989AEA
MAQAALPEPDPAPLATPQPTEPSFDVLRWHDEPWTAQLALDLLPVTNGPKVEVLSGSVIVTPHAGYDHQDAELDLAYLLKQAARRAKLWLYIETNVVSGDDLFIPDIVVLNVPGGGRTTMDIRHAVLLGEIVSPRNRRKDVIDRPREYAAVGVPFFLRVDLRNRVPTIALFELTEGEYRPVAAAAAGSSFVMREPFDFSVDPAELLGDEAPVEESATGEG